MTRCEAGTGSSTVPRKAFTGGYEDVQKISARIEALQQARDYRCKEGKRLRHWTEEVHLRVDDNFNRDDIRIMAYRDKYLLSIPGLIHFDKIKFPKK